LHDDKEELAELQVRFDELQEEYNAQDHEFTDAQILLDELKAKLSKKRKVSGDAEAPDAAAAQEQREDVESDDDWVPLLLRLVRLLAQVVDVSTGKLSNTSSPNWFIECLLDLSSLRPKQSANGTWITTPTCNFQYFHGSSIVKSVVCVNSSCQLWWRLLLPLW
jgi:hypothetical protein